MDTQRSVVFMRALRHVPSRRDVLRGLAASGLGLGFARFPDLAAAKKKRKHKKRKKQVKPTRPNAFGCLEVGDQCTSEDPCCSGICEGKKGKQTCRAHDTGTCPQDMPGLCTASDPALLSCNSKASCSCYRTTAGSNACLELAHADSTCSDCRTDADCLALGLPPGSACVPVPVAEGNCTDFCASGMACLGPCPNPDPA